MITLLQFRTDRSGPHEVSVFFDCLDVPYNMLRVINVADIRVTRAEIKKAIDSSEIVIAGGSGELGYQESDPHLLRLLYDVQKKMLPLLQKDILGGKKPFLGVCFGMQLLAHSMGVDIVGDPKQAESGIIDVHLTEEGKDDPIFMAEENHFAAIAAHKSSLKALPQGAVKLAFSNACAIHAMRYSDHIYGTMFHPELDYQKLEDRIHLNDTYTSYRDLEGGVFEHRPVHTARIVSRFIKNTGRI